MQLHQLKRNTPNKKAKRVGRGGKRGKTSGRGMKGQKARAGTSGRPEMRDIIKKLPKLRGHGKNRARTVNSSVVKPRVINVSNLETLFSNGDVINPKVLLEKGIIRRQKTAIPTVKILGNGEIKKKLTIERCVVSESARKKIESAGGKIT